MEKTVKILLFESVAGLDFAFGKGENDVPEQLAAEWVKIGLAEYPGAKKPVDTAERATSPQAKKAEKR